MDDYDNLVEKPCKKVVATSRVGSTAMYYIFLPQIVDTANRHGINFRKFLQQELYKKPYFDRAINRCMTETKNPNLTQCRYTSWKHYTGSGHLSPFRPIIAKALYCKFNPKTILDPSCGFGGRCLAAMSMNINYIGIDTNRLLKPLYNKMVKTFPSDSQVKILIKDSSKVNYSQFKYDMVFTSPPYYNLEVYPYMTEYSSHEDYNDKFFYPMLTKSYESLQSGGVYALNIPHNQYPYAKEKLGKAEKTIKLSIGVRNQSGSKVGAKEYGELIYIWIK
jgi:hypothetical protein